LNKIFIYFDFADSAGLAGKSAENLPIPLGRKRSNSCAVDPFVAPTQTVEESSIVSLEQRIELLKAKVATAEVGDKEPAAPLINTPTNINVGSMVENFERLSKRDQAANIDSRIERLKRDVSRVIDSPARRRTSVDSVLDSPPDKSPSLSRESSRELRDSNGQPLSDILAQTLSQIQNLPNSALSKQDILQRLRGQ
jgi:hypothetical protein